ncbi:MAG TPA: PAS domain-containing protein, partial [Kofleriaceae bacterium]|nr:PAS domain-containing protein [Kofleriaceae bacterium]
MEATRSAALLLSDPAMRAIAREAFTERGYSVREVDGAGALDLVRAGKLALVEIGPGGVTADALAEARTGRLPSLAKPVMAAVPVGALEVARAALAAGASSVVSLPFDQHELAVRLDVLCRWARDAERFHEVLTHLPSRVMVFDRDGRLVFLNRTGAAGAVDRLLAGPRIDDFPAELRDAALRAGRKALEIGAPVDREAQVTGVWMRLRAIPLDPAARRGGFALIADDISEHRRAEAELRASSAKAAALLDALPDVVFRVSAAGVLLDFRSERGNLVDLPPDRVIGSRLEEVFPPDLCQVLRPSIDLALTSQRVQRIEHSLAGSPRDLEIRLVASGGEVVAVVRDMTESKYVQERLALADRLAALGSLSAGVAHEINNPLTYILIGIESVLKELRRLAPDEPVGERLEVLIERLQGAMEGARRVRRIVSDLRTFARADEEAEKRIDPRAVLDAALSMVDSQIRYRARLIREYGPLPQVLGNQDRLVQVFVNLLLNAAQSMPEAQASHNFIRLRTYQDEAGRAVIEVEDCGHGIASENLGRVFDPFYTTKPIG